VSNPLDHDRRFLVTFPSSFSGLCLTLTQFDCKKAAYCAIMGCGGREGVHYSGFHQYLLCWWWVIPRTVALLLRPSRLHRISTDSVEKVENTADAKFSQKLARF
jgi:hypothetical protein